MINRKDLKVGVIGFGYWGKNQARVFNELGCLSGIYEKNFDNYREFENDYKFFSNFDDLIACSNAIVICTPANTHFKIALDSLEAGKDVLVEKPIAMSSKEVNKLKEIEDKNKKIIMVGHQLHFHPAIIKLKKIISSNAIGNIEWIYSNRLNMGKIRPYENVLWSFAPHDISLIIDIFNEPIKSIEIQGSKILNKKIEDTSLTMLNFKNNKKAHIFVSWLHPFKEQRLVVVGKKGSIVFSDSDKKDKLKLYKTNILENGLISSHTAQILDYGSEEPLKEQAKYFLKALESRKVFINNSEHAHEVVSILEKCTKLLMEK